MFLGTLGLLTIPVQQLLVGGALTGVIVGIAAQQPLSKLFAGLVLLITRPLAVEQWVRIHSGALGGPLEGSVIEMGLIYTTLQACNIIGDQAESIVGIPFRSQKHPDNPQFSKNER